MRYWAWEKPQIEEAKVINKFLACIPLITISFQNISIYNIHFLLLCYRIRHLGWFGGKKRWEVVLIKKPLKSD